MNSKLKRIQIFKFEFSRRFCQAFMSLTTTQGFTRLNFSKIVTFEKSTHNINFSLNWWKSLKNVLFRTTLPSDPSTTANIGKWINSPELKSSHNGASRTSVRGEHYRCWTRTGSMGWAPGARSIFHKICAKFLKKIAKMHYFILIFKNLKKPALNFRALGRKTQIVWKVLRIFDENSIENGTFNYFWKFSFEK